MGLASRRGQRTAGTVACRHRSSPKKHPWETLHQGLSAVSLSQRWLAARVTLWLPFTVAQSGCAAELPANVFTGDSRWHLVTGAFGGLGRLAVNWLREKARRPPSGCVDGHGYATWRAGRRARRRCDVGDAGQLATVLTIKGQRRHCRSDSCRWRIG